MTTANGGLNADSISTLGHNNSHTHTHSRGDKPDVVDFIGVHVVLSQVLTPLSRLQHMPNVFSLPLQN